MTVEDERCPYELVASTTLEAGDLVEISYYQDVDLSGCFDLCDNVTSDAGVECWAFSSHQSTDDCVIFFTTDPYSLMASKHHLPDADWNLYIKQCYSGKFFCVQNTSL